MGAHAPSPRRGVRHATHALPQGDALAGLLLPRRRDEFGRRELARADRVASRSADRRIRDGEGALLSPDFRRGADDGRPWRGAEAHRVNIVDSTDEDIRAIADPLWRHLLKSSNEG